MIKALRTIAGIACAFSIVLAGCETANGGMSLPWTLGWMAFALVLALVLDATKENTNDNERQL